MNNKMPDHMFFFLFDINTEQTLMEETAIHYIVQLAYTLLISLITID